MMAHSTLKTVAHLSQSDAADQLNVCVTTFKIVLRELGMTNWPFRQIQSVKRIAQLVRNNPELFEDRAELVAFVQMQDRAELLAFLQMHEGFIFCNPSQPKGGTLKEVRQFVYTKIHASRRARG